MMTTPRKLQVNELVRDVKYDFRYWTNGQLNRLVATFVKRWHDDKHEELFVVVSDPETGKRRDIMARSIKYISPAMEW